MLRNKWSCSRIGYNATLSACVDVGSSPTLTAKKKIMFGWPSGLRQQTVNLPRKLISSIGSNPIPNAKMVRYSSDLRGET